jgi:hypothetical protein
VVALSARLKNEFLEWREVEGEIVAMDLRRSTYLAVNRTGAVLWPLLARGTTAEELAEAVTEAFEVERDVAERDVDAFLLMLREHDLLEPS